MEPIGSFSGLASGIQWRDMIDQIMKLEANRQLGPVQKHATAQEKRQSAWAEYSSYVSLLSDAATKLRDGSAFGVFAAKVQKSASGKDLLSASASTLATPGTYRVEVTGLARADKVSGAEAASATTALNLAAGEFYLNGRKVDVVATDSLTAIRDKINAVNSGSNPTGVTATILSTSATAHRLILTADSTGSRGIEMVDGATSVLQNLGIVTGTKVANTSTSDPTRTDSQRFSSKTTTLAALLGVSSPPAVTTIKVDGRKIVVDLVNDTLYSVMTRVNAAGGQASLQDEVVGGKTFERLQVQGTVTADLDADADPVASQRIVELLGFVRPARASEVTAGADASAKIDGFTVTSRTNSLGSAIPGVTIDLLQAEPGSEVELSVTRDVTSVVAAFQGFAAAYNDALRFVDGQRQSGAPLASASALRSMMSSLKNTLITDVPGLDPTKTSFTRAGAAGIALGRDGQLAVDVGKLTTALNSNLADVKALFSTTGVASDGQVSYSGSTARTVAGDYAVSITAPPSVATSTGSDLGAGFTYTASNGVSDTLTFLDSVSGLTRGYVVQQGSDLSTIAAGLDLFFTNEGLRLRAERVGDSLRIRSTDVGSSSAFTVSGTEAASRLGVAVGTSAGVDVQGTIGGLAATGNGYFLTGDAGGVTEGLAIKYDGAAANATAGTIRFVRGIGGQMEALAKALTTEGSGAIPKTRAALDLSIQSLNAKMDSIQARLELRRASLIRQFTRMESAVGTFQSQGNWLTGQIKAMQPSR